MHAKSVTEDTSVVQQRPIIRYQQVWDNGQSKYIYKELGEPEEKVAPEGTVLIVRRLCNRQGEYTSTRVEIADPVLVGCLLDINKDVEGLSLKQSPPKADPKLFYHSLPALRDALDLAESLPTRDDRLIFNLETAIKFTETEFQDAIETVDKLRPDQEISWDVVWTLFTPNCMVYHRDELTEDPQVLIYRHSAIGTRDGQTFWIINCDYITNDGANFGLANRSLEIPFFNGTKKFQDLPVFPFNLHTTQMSVRAKLVARGRSFASLQKPSYWQIKGIGAKVVLNADLDPKVVRFNAVGRAIVDAASFRECNPDSALIARVHKELVRTGLTDDQLVTCSPHALGFSFGNKCWCLLAVSRLTPVQWSSSPFDSLVIDPSQKNLIYSLVKQHGWTDGTVFDDVVAGKGRGLVGLLNGRPGCGKTLTAEAVAEKTQRPLYMVSAGELGTEAAEVDKQLSLILDLAFRWRAVLLLDEADVFLQERDMSNVKQNALVSVFLRQLEYFQGILILTTNRLHTCDAAFESRIHFLIDYADLNYDARRSVWSNFLHRASNEGSIKSSDIDTFASREMNGRQIKNAVSVADILARDQEEPLRAEHIHTVLRARNSRFAAKEVS